MSYQILPRSRWTTTSPGGAPINWSRVRGIVAHYPGSPGRFGVLSPAQEAANFRGWRNYHTRNLGWKDIGYCYGITQAGRIYQLRGDRVGGHTYGHNSTTIGVMFMVGNDEPLTDAARGAFRALRATLRKRGCGSAVWGHREMPKNSTACPGPHIMADIRNGKLTGRATSAPAKKAPAKKSPAKKKATSKAPAFPLPKGFYYGPPSGPVTSVSGRARNSRVPSDVVRGSNGRWYSKGLKRWQAQMLARGWHGLGAADGRFGPATRRAVGQFQRNKGLKVDHAIGPETWAAAWKLPVT